LKYKCAAAFYGQAAHERLDDADRSPAAQVKPVADSSFDIRAGRSTGVDGRRDGLGTGGLTEICVGY
jgi:hypothetical protein